MLPELSSNVLTKPPTTSRTNLQRNASAPSLRAIARQRKCVPAKLSSPFIWMLALAGLLLLAFPAAGQTGRTKVTHTPVRHTPSHRETKVSSTTTAIPPAPPAPVPPIQQAARPAKVAFTGGQLRIDADNSSLSGILQQISHETGLVVEGMNRDQRNQRIYGQYGPGPVSGTLEQLLDGAGYNYIIVDGAPGHPPAKLLLTPGNGAPAGAPANASALASSAPAASPTPSSETANPSAPVEPKTVQQIFDELRRLHPKK